MCELQRPISAQHKQTARDRDIVKYLGCDTIAYNARERKKNTSRILF